VVGERADIEVEGFLFDDGPHGNIQQLLTHGVHVDDVNAVLAGGPLFFSNAPGRRASHLMIGRDGRGRSLLIAIVATAEPGIWEPITGWRSAAAHRLLAQEEQK
jgi:hypothetical protein